MRAMRKKQYHWISGLLVIYPIFFFQTDQHPATNLAIFDRLASDFIQTIFSQAASDTSQQVTIQAPSHQDAADWWIQNCFIKELSRHGARNIHLQKEARSAEGLIIEYRINDLRVTYLPTLQKDFVARQFTFDVAVRLLEGTTGLVKLLDSATQQHADTVRVSLLGQLEDETYPFTTAIAPQRQRIRNYIEPIVVMATTAGVIFLFFHLRSK